jgi:myosin heavy subunit
MPEQPAGEVASQEWSQESVEKQAIEQAEAKPDAKPEGETETDPPKEKVDYVPHKAFHEERARRKEAQRQAQELQAQNAQLVRQQQEILARMQQQTAVQQLPPADDPLAVMQHGIGQTQAELRALRERQEWQDRQTYEQNQWAQFTNAVHTAQSQFASEQPDAIDGINFLKQGRFKEYVAMGMTQDAARRQLHQDEVNLSAEAFKNGDNPAKVAYDMAVARGYVPPKQRLDMQKEGQGASMPSGSGGKGGGLPSLDALLKMSPGEFAKATSGENWEKLMKKHS